MPKKSSPGKKRPWKFDEARRRRYCELLARGGRRIVSARAVGVDIKTVERAITSDKAFAEAVSGAEMEADQHVEDALYKSALRGNVTAQQVWLYNRRPDRWQDRRNVVPWAPEGGRSLQEIVHVIVARYGDAKAADGKGGNGQPPASGEARIDWASVVESEKSSGERTMPDAPPGG